MEEVFITKIHIDQVRHLRDITIELDSEERKHLIITGKNGSGKTSVLEGLAFSLDKSATNDSSTKIGVNFSAAYSKTFFSELILETDTVPSGIIPKIEFILKYFPVKRTFKAILPTGINKLELNEKINIESSISENILQFLVNLQAEKAFANEDGEKRKAIEINTWLNNFENSLKDLFNDSDLKLVFDRKEFNFYLHLGNGNRVTMNQLSDGYSAILSIISELILRMEDKKTDLYDVQGVVLIDELETHLHIDLQKKILPFLTAFFPKIQFIVTTHSPFVINSVEDAVVFDLENKIRIEDATGYSYDTLIESYFGADKYSMKVKEDVERFEELSFKNDLSAKEERELSRLDHFFKTIPLAYAPELEVKLQQIKLKKLIPQANGQRH